jgi:hypothetical protein
MMSKRSSIIDGPSSKSLNNINVFSTHCQNEVTYCDRVTPKLPRLAGGHILCHEVAKTTEEVFEHREGWLSCTSHS